MSEEQKDSSQKTEEPSQRRLEKAREEGDVITSKEVNTFLLFLFFSISIYFALPAISKKAIEMLFPYIQLTYDISIDPISIKSIYIQILVILGLLLALPFAVTITSLLLGYWAQHNGFVFSTKSLKFDLKKISPIAGFSRIFSVRSLVELLKNILKISLVGLAIFLVIGPEMQSMREIYQNSWSAILKIVFLAITKMFFTVSGIMAFLALLDYAYQRYAYMQKMRMTKQEVKDEHKQSEGDPEIKGKLRKMRLQKMKQRMLAAVPKATVVITNPTHYAVALYYEPNTMSAPQLVAKGVDNLALKIKTVAKDNSVPVIENKALARALYDSVELDEIIPYEYYKSVADIIAYIMKLR